MFLDINPYLFIAIGLIVLIAAIFIITFVINRRTPVPKGCEHLKIEESNCMACTFEEDMTSNKKIKNIFVIVLNIIV